MKSNLLRVSMLQKNDPNFDCKSYAKCVLVCGLCEEDVLVGIMKNVMGLC